MATKTLSITEIYEEYRKLEDAEDGISDASKGRVAACGLIATDCLELFIMASYRKASKQRQKSYLKRTVDAYKAAYPLDDVFSTAAREVLQKAAEKLEQVKL